MAALSPAARRRALRAWTIYHRVGLHEVVVVGVSFLVYFGIRAAVVGDAETAIDHGLDLMAFQRWLGLSWELEMQSWLDGRYLLTRSMNIVYFWGHMPLVIVFAVWLFLRHRSTYGLARNAFLASGAIGVMVYWLYPVAPPRLIPDAGFIDTMALYDRYGYNAQETQAFVNPYAALPSLHFGWSLLLATMVAWVGRNPAAIALGVVWPFAMFFAVVMTGNHFVIDAILGGIVAFAGLGAAVVFARYWSRLFPSWLSPPASSGSDRAGA